MDTRLSRFVKVALLTVLLAATGVACASAPKEPIALASFTESSVSVSVYLERNPAGGGVLSATFTPPVGYHLYSLDTPIKGVNGLGRPTLLELTANSHMKATGDLVANVSAEEPDFESGGLLVYPLGAVTLSLPVELPRGKDWVDDEISVTFMACGAIQCKLPVIGKIVVVRIPGAEMSSHE